MNKGGLVNSVGRALVDLLMGPGWIEADSEMTVVAK